MNDFSEEERAAYAAVDDALRSWPQRPPPPALARRVLAALPPRPAPPRFRLAWLDYALSALGAGMAALLLLSWRLVTPQMLVQFQTQLVLVASRSQAGAGGLWLLLAAASALAALGLLFFAALLFRQPALRR